MEQKNSTINSYRASGSCCFNAVIGSKEQRGEGVLFLHGGLCCLSEDRCDGSDGCASLLTEHCGQSSTKHNFEHDKCSMKLSRLQILFQSSAARVKEHSSIIGAFSLEASSYSVHSAHNKGHFRTL